MSDQTKKGFPDRFAVIDNRLLEDPSISWQAKGLQSYLISRPDGWRISSRHLASIGIGGKDRIQSILNELQLAGYIFRERINDKLGRIAYTSWIYQHPSQNPNHDPSATVAVFSGHGKTGHGKHGHSVKTKQEKTKQEKTLIINSLTLTEQPEKSADAERNASNLDNPPPASHLETLSNPLEVETHQTTRQDGKQSILEGNQLINNHLPVHIPDPSGDKDPAAACSMILDKNKTILGKPTLKAQQQDRARSGSHLSRGIKNKRWDNLADFKKFKAYAIEWARQRREKVTPGTDGQEYGEKWIEIVLDRTANCANEDSTDLTCWKNWQLEKQAFSPEFVAPELAVVTTTIEESRARFKKILDASKLEAAKNQAAHEAEQRASQETRWGLMSA
jgi:hypothetical protein